MIALLCHSIHAIRLATADNYCTTFKRMPPRHSFIPTTITAKILQSRMMGHFSLWRRLGLVPDSSAIRQSSFLPTALDTARYVCLQVFKPRQVGRLVFCRGVQASKILHGISLGNSLANHSSLLFPGHEIASSIAMRRPGA
ncbi:hypothetical protein EDD85DRAFT_2573 [Armillaria nabsnona]|nr:hypothetical protein EDD85DRAFT_2573 [Armillaria nabsnona]